jgi:hypothetical protein
MAFPILDVTIISGAMPVRIKAPLRGEGIPGQERFGAEITWTMADNSGNQILRIVHRYPNRIELNDIHISPGYVIPDLHRIPDFVEQFFDELYD